jgi:hypothetical protein
MPVEPGRGRLGGLQGVRPPDAADERLLQDVLGLVPAAHPAVQEAKEGRVVVQEQAQDVWAARVALGELGCGGLERETHGSVGYGPAGDGPALVSGRSLWQCSYSHPHPQLQEPLSQGQDAPQVELQPQEQPWVLSVVSVIVGLRFGAGCPASYIVAFIPANAPPREPLHPQRRPIRVTCLRCLAYRPGSRRSAPRVPYRATV